MKAVLVEPMKRPEIVEITASLEELQRIVGGKIEVLYPFEDEVGLICGLSASDFDSLSDGAFVYGRADACHSVRKKALSWYIQQVPQDGKLMTKIATEF